jgi:hypothetical protein
MVRMTNGLQNLAALLGLRTEQYRPAWLHIAWSQDKHRETLSDSTERRQSCTMEKGPHPAWEDLKYHTIQGQRLEKGWRQAGLGQLIKSQCGWPYPGTICYGLFLFSWAQKKHCWIHVAESTLRNLAAILRKKEGKKNPEMTHFYFFIYIFIIVPLRVHCDIYQHAYNIS